MPITADTFYLQLEESGLMTAEEIAAFRKSLAQRPRDGQELARSLIRAGKLTKYQASAVYQGKTKGLVLGNYRILDKIGAGGMGQVFKAEHRRMERVVAIKVLPPRTTGSKESVERFHREVKAAARLEHGNIVTAFDADEAQGVHFLVMQFVDGSDLASIVKSKGPLPVEQALDYVLQAARGLAYAHEQGVVHRDIKPGNLLVDKAGTVKILDMGLARLDTSVDRDEGAQLTQSGQIMGTVDYMSPEQAEDTREADHRSDIYSLGCTLYTLLTARPVYAGDTLMRKLMAHREAAVPSLCEARQDVPPALDAVFRRMVAKRPEDRQASMQDVIDELEKCRLAAAGVAVRPSPPPSRGPRPGSDAGLSRYPVAVPMGLESRGAPQAAVQAREVSLAGPEQERTFVGGDTAAFPMLPGAAPRGAAARYRQAGKLPPPVWMIAALGAGGVAVLVLLAGLIVALTTGDGEPVASNPSSADGSSEEPSAGEPSGTPTPGRPHVNPYVNVSGELIRELARETGNPALDIQGEYVHTDDGVNFQNYSVQVYHTGPARQIRGAVYPYGLPGNSDSATAPHATLDGAFSGTRGSFGSPPNWIIENGEMKFVGSVAGGATRLKRIVRRSPTLGAAPPAEAVVLYDGGVTNEFQGGEEIVDGSQVLLGVGGKTQRPFRDFTMHVEFRTPLLPDRSGQARGNSGVFLQNRYEIQILDSFGLPPSDRDCGAIYGLAAPPVNMCLPPMTWQTYDIDFTAARFGADGKKTENAQLTLRHNGVLVHAGAALTRQTLGGQAESDAPGPIVLQDHGDEVQFRNIWLVEHTGASPGNSSSSGTGPADVEGFVSLFDGRTLAGWDGNRQLWSVEDGALTGQCGAAGDSPSGNTCLVWRGGEPDDFELRLKFRIESGNSGVQIRSFETSPWTVRGYQADLNADHSFTGVIYDEGGRGILCRAGEKTMIPTDGQRRVLATVSSPDRIRAALREGDWNEMTITAQGVWILVNVNGVRTAELNDQQYGESRKSGVLALQLHTRWPTKVQFKDIRLKRL